MPNLPGGTVTFLFTDTEGSTRLWEEKGHQHPYFWAPFLLMGDWRR